MKKSNKQNYIETFRIPIPPPDVTHVDRKEKRKRKFDYKSELEHY